jgi:UDP-3-O-[3-hydroxymyristoyl] glucosamine N-acyltransferase
MADPRFYFNQGPFTLGELGQRLGATLPPSAPVDLAITDIANLEDAGPTELALFADPRYRDVLASTKACAVLTTPELAPLVPDGPQILTVASPRLAFAEAEWLFYPATPEALGFVDERDQATIGEGCRIAPTAMIGRGAIIGPNTDIGAGAVIGPAVGIGAECVIGPHATIAYALIGDRVQIYAGVVIGSQGFGFVPGGRGLRRIPQLGRVIIGNDVEVGANTTIDRGALGDTAIGDGTVLDNQIQIGHNVRIGRYCTFSGRVGISGSVDIGDGVMVGGGVGVADHLTIGARARLAAGAGVIQNVAPGATVAGYPAIPIRDWHRQTVGLAQMFWSHRKKRKQAAE